MVDAQLSGSGTLNGGALSGAETFNHPSNDWYIGNNHLGRYHNNQIGSVRVWDMARSADQVLGDRASPETNHTGVRVVLPFAVDGSDVSGNGHHATLYGGATVKWP